jgi:hypothetical protein
MVVSFGDLFQDWEGMKDGKLGLPRKVAGIKPYKA